MKGVKDESIEIKETVRTIETCVEGLKLMGYINQLNIEEQMKPEQWLVKFAF